MIAQNIIRNHAVVNNNVTDIDGNKVAPNDRLSKRKIVIA